MSLTVGILSGLLDCCFNMKFQACCDRYFNELFRRGTSSNSVFIHRSMNTFPNSTQLRMNTNQLVYLYFSTTYYQCCTTKIFRFECTSSISPTINPLTFLMRFCLATHQLRQRATINPDEQFSCPFISLKYLRKVGNAG